MTIHCKLCKYAIRSDRPDSEAQADVMRKMSQHLGAAHLPKAQEFAKGLATVAGILTNIQGLASSYILLTRFVDIPESETALLESYRQCRADLDLKVDLVKILEEPGEILGPTAKPSKANTLH